MDIRRILCLATSLAICGSAFAAQMDAMQGAWAMDGTDCTDVFEKAGGEIRFKDPDSSLDTGIIVSGSKIVGPNGTCTRLPTSTCPANSGGMA